MPWTSVAALAVYIASESINKKDFINLSEEIYKDNNLIKKEDKPVAEIIIEKKKSIKKINYLDYL